MFMLIKIIIFKIQKDQIKWVPSVLSVGQETLSFRLYFNLRYAERKLFLSQETSRAEWMLPEKSIESFSAAFRA